VAMPWHRLQIVEYLDPNLEAALVDKLPQFVRKFWKLVLVGLPTLRSIRLRLSPMLDGLAKVLLGFLRHKKRRFDRPPQILFSSTSPPPRPGGEP